MVRMLRNCNCDILELLAELLALDLTICYALRASPWPERYPTHHRPCTTLEAGEGHVSMEVAESEVLSNKRANAHKRRGWDSKARRRKVRRNMELKCPLMYRGRWTVRSCTRSHTPEAPHNIRLTLCTCLPLKEEQV